MTEWEEIHEERKRKEEESNQNNEINGFNPKTYMRDAQNTFTKASTFKQPTMPNISIPKF